MMMEGGQQETLELVHKVRQALEELNRVNVGAEQRQLANNWLVQLQETDHIWNVCDSILRSSVSSSANDDINAKFYATTTLVAKARVTISRQPKLTLEIRQRLCSYLRLYVSGPILLLRQLISAITTAHLLGNDSDSCSQLVMRTQKELEGTTPTWNQCLLMLLSSFAEGVANSTMISEKRREELRVSMRPIMGQVLSLAGAHLSRKERKSSDNNNNNENILLLQLALGCLTQWVVALRLGLPFLFSFSLFSEALHGLLTSDNRRRRALVMASVCELLREATSNTGVGDGGENDASLFSALQMLVGVIQPIFSQETHQPTTSRSSSKGICSAIASLVSKLGEVLVWSVMRGERQEDHQFVEFVVECCRHPSYAVSQELFGFWDDVQTVPVNQRHPSFREPLFLYLLPFFVAQAMYPVWFKGVWDEVAEEEEDDEDIDEDSFRTQRSFVKDMLYNVATLLRSQSLGRLCHMLQSVNPQEWRLVEGALFGISCVVEPLVDHFQSGTVVDAVELNNISTLLNELLTNYLFTPRMPQHPLVIETALQIIESLAHWLRREPASLEISLQRAVQLLDLPTASLAASKLLKRICIVCLPEVVSADALFRWTLSHAAPTSPNRLTLGPAARLNLVEGLSRVIFHRLRQDQDFSLLTELVQPLENTIQGLAFEVKKRFDARDGNGMVVLLPQAVSLLELLAALFQESEFYRTSPLQLSPSSSSSSISTEGPVSTRMCGVLERLLPHLQLFLEGFSFSGEAIEAVCIVYHRAIRSEQDELLSLLPAVVFSLVTNFKSSLNSSYLLPLGTALEVFSLGRGLEASFVSMIHEITTTLFQALQTIPDLSSVIVGFFSQIIDKVVTGNPSTTLSKPSVSRPSSSSSSSLSSSPSPKVSLLLSNAGTLPLLMQIIQLGLLNLHSRDKEVLMGITNFLLRMVQSLATPGLDEIVRQCLGEGEVCRLLVTKLMLAIVDTAPRELLSSFSDILFHLIASFPSFAHLGLQQVLLSNELLPTSSTSSVLTVEREERERILGIAFGLKNNIRRFRAFISDVADVFRAQMTPDVLLAYQM
jgi:hypothetical protein